MRRSGILLHITSLPSPYGVGAMGLAARNFVDFLVKSGQSAWQILPICPTSYGDSPYQSFSSYAGNPYFIDLDDLVADGLLEPEEFQNIHWGDNPLSVDFGLLYEKRFPVLRLAVERLWLQNPKAVRSFIKENSQWLPDYALFMALKTQYDGASWLEWPEEIRCRTPKAMKRAKGDLVDDIAFWEGLQCLFFRQWYALKTYANEKGIAIIGDIPIYVASDSVDVWANPHQFQLDADLVPTAVAGCPPDGFSADGQLWGNPLFDWKAMKEDGYQWWIDRVAYQSAIYDTVRIDHFRGFDAYYAIPYGAKTAQNGTWKKGPGYGLFQAIDGAIGKQDIIAEDLGFLTPSVYKLLNRSGFPGMKILQFAFDSRDGSGYLPHSYIPNSVAYVGTHDNDTIYGWLQNAPQEDVAKAVTYLRLTGEEGYVWGMLRSLWACASDLAVTQMQDLLALGSEGRMNTPATLGDNWKWRAPITGFSDQLAEDLRREMGVYCRLPEQIME